MANYKTGAERYNDRMAKLTERARQAFNTPRYQAAAYDLITAAKDALKSLERLPDTEGAFRVTCIQQLKAALIKAGALPEEN